MTENKTVAIVGAVEHGNSVELVTIIRGGGIVDRRRVDLTGPDLPTHPYHHQGAWAVGRYKDSPWAQEISLEDAIRLVEQVEAAAGEGARRALAELQEAISAPIERIAIRHCPEMPDSIEARIRDNRIQTMADSVMYRLALAAAAQSRGWGVYWYDRETVFSIAADRLGGDSKLKAALNEMGRNVGAPWQAKHKLAAAAAIAGS